MKSAEIKELSVKELQERIEAQKAQLTKLKVQHAGKKQFPGRKQCNRW